MTRHDLEEQESQVVEYDYEVDALMTSSPPVQRTADHVDEYGGEAHRDGDETLSGPALLQGETQHDSIRSRVEETQFEILEPATQIFNEPSQEPSQSFQGRSTPSQAMSSKVHTTTRADDLPTFTVERPKDLDLDEGATGFKFGKVKQPNKFSPFVRPSGKGADAARQSASTTVGKQNPLVHSQSNFQQASVPSNPVIKEAHASSERMRDAADTMKTVVPSNDVQSLSNQPPPQPAPSEEKDQELLQQHVPETVEAMEPPTSNPGPLLESPAKETSPRPQNARPQKQALKSATKNNKHVATKPPFPEVSETPCRQRMKAAAALDQPHTTAASHPLRSRDINRPIPETAPNNKNVEPAHIDAMRQQVYTSATTNVPSCGRSHASNKLLDVGQQATGHDDLEGAETSGIQMSLALAPTGDLHHHESQRSGGCEQVFAHHHEEVGPESLLHADAQMPHTGYANCNNQLDGERHFQVQPPSRPQSAMSNTAKQRLRPLAAEDLQPQGVSEALVVRHKHPMKVQKSKGGQSYIGGGAKSHPRLLETTNEQQDPLSAITGFRDFIQYLPRIEETLHDYGKQKEVLGSQQVEIAKLNSSTMESSKQIKRLEEEKSALAAKIKKFTEISARYKTHMNDVVNAQKHLLAESNKIKAESLRVREESKAALKAHEDRESHVNMLRNLIYQAKSVRPPIEKLEELEKENVKYKADIERVERTNELLQSELNARMLDLGRERHNTEQLQKSLDAQNDAHKELVETLKKAQSTIVEELTKEGSFLANIINSESTIQMKIDELSAFINTVNSREPDIPPALIKLIEDLYARIENKLQATEDQEVALNESSLKLFEDLKERINQLRLDEEGKASLNERISQLRESNATLTASGRARELECQGITKRIDELGRELSSCRGQLEEKSDELAALRAIPKEDPILLGKIHHLENTTRILEGQINTANQEASRVKEELLSTREAMQGAQEQSQELQARFAEAQNMIESLIEDKKKYLANHKAEVDKARHEVAKSANAAKAEAKLQHDCLVNNLEQRRSESEKELALAQEELQKNREQRAGHDSNLNKLQEELSACKKQIAQQSAYIKNADERLPARDEFERREEEFQQAIAGMAELKAYFDSLQKETSQKVGEAVSSYQKETEKLVKSVDTLEKEKASLEKQNSGIQKTYDAFRANVERGLRQSSILGAKQSVDEWAAIPIHTPLMPPPVAPMANFSSSQHPLLASFDLSSSQRSTSNDEVLSRGMPGTPQDALRRNEMMLESATPRTATLQLTASIQHHRASQITQRKIDTLSESVQRPNLRATIGSTNPPITKSVVESSVHPPYHSSSSYQPPLKPPRPANRKSSGLAQSAQTEKSMKPFERLEANTSALNALLYRTGETFITEQTPTGMATSSEEVSHTSSGHKLRIRTQALVVGNSAKPLHTNSAKPEERSMTTQAPTDMTALTEIPLLSSSSSPLPEPSPVDLIGYTEEDFEKSCTETNASKTGPFADMEYNGNRASATLLFAEHTIAGVKFKDMPASYQFSDEDNLSGVSASFRPPIISATEESTRRRQSKPLKSALRSSGKTRDKSIRNEAQKDVVQVPMSPPVAPALQKTTSRASASKKPSASARARKGTVGSSYNRIASGSKSDASASVQISAVPSTIQRSSAIKQTISNGEKSPMMNPPKRSARKRSASLAGTNSQPIKPFKQARVSLPNQVRKDSRDVIPDSQEADYRH